MSSPAWKRRPRGPKPSATGASNGRASTNGIRGGGACSARRLARPGDPVDGETGEALEPAQRPPGVGAEDAVEHT